MTMFGLAWWVACRLYEGPQVDGVQVLSAFWGAVAAIAPALGFLFGKAGEARAKGRQAEADIALTRDATRTSQYGIQQNATSRALEAAERGLLDRAQLDLLQRQFALNAPGTRLHQALRGSIISNYRWQPAPSHPRAHVVQFRSPLADGINPDVRALGALIAKQNLTAQQRGDQFSPVPATNFLGGILQPPKETPLPRANGFDSFLNWAGAIGAGIGALDKSGAFGGASDSAPSSSFLNPEFLEKLGPLFGRPSVAQQYANQPLPNTFIRPGTFGS